MKARHIIGIGLIVIIIVSGIFIFKNRDVYFRQDIFITYPDGCVEKYINGEIVTLECTRGRMMEADLVNNPMGNKYQNLGGLNIVTDFFEYEINQTWDNQTNTTFQS